MKTYNQTIIVEIPREISEQVREKFYIYNFSNNLLQRFVMDKEVPYKNLDKCFSINEKNSVELETLKQQISTQYAPKEFESYNYNFDFINSTIVYEKIT